MKETSSDHPKRLGEFDIHGLIGQGGMGTVYRASQQSLGRTVALKCLARTGDPDAKERFLREVQALGMVSHPHLIKVFASGSEDGVTFFAMELIDGADLSSISSKLQSMNRPPEKLTRQDWLKAFEAACRAREKKNLQSAIGVDESSLNSPDSSSTSGSSSSRLRSPRNYSTLMADLFRQIAEAVAALHAAGIVHRDIKPGNIIARDYGTDVVLMDLGLAHIAEHGKAALTRTRQFVGTLRYASPEQVLSAANVDGRTDIYSLGATLWEMLTLRPLFASSSEGSDFDMMQRIEYEDPASVRSLNPAVPTDLSAIVDKCLAKNPARRYQTATELAEDLRRFLDGETVTARPLSNIERFKNIIARHPLHATSIALLLIVGSLLFGLWSIRSQLEAQRVSNKLLDEANSRAERGFRDAVKALDGIFQLVTDEEFRDLEELQPVQRQLMEYYVSYIRQYDAHKEFRVELAVAYGRVARIQQEIGDVERALSSYADALRLVQNLLDDEAPESPARFLGGEYHISRALLFLEKGEYTSCAEDLSEADRILKSAESSDDATLIRLTAEVQHSRGRLQLNQGKYTDSLQSFRTALQLRQDLFKSHSDALTKRDLGRSYGYLGDVEVALGDYVGARTSYLASMQLREELVQEASASHEAKFQLARAHRNLGFLSQLEGHIPEAIASYRLATDIQKRLVQQHPSITTYRTDFATDSTVLGELLLIDGDRDSAVALLKNARDATTLLLGKSPDDVETTSVAFHASVLLARASVDSDAESFLTSLTAAEALSGRLKQLSADDLFNQALLRKLRQQFMLSREPASDVASTAAEAAEISLLLAKAMDDSRFTIAPRVKRESAFDSILLPSSSKAPADGGGDGRRGLTLDQTANVDTQRKILALCVGVSDYRDDSLDLAWAENDAKELSDLFTGLAATHENGETAVLTDKNASRGAILKKLAKMREQTDASSLFVLQLSGHGLLNPLGEYYFVPHDFDRNGVISASGVSWYDIEQEISRMDGAVLIILDTCHSGAAVQGGARRPLAGAMDRTIEEIVHQISRAQSRGVVVLSSALTDQTSAEKDEWRHGPLTLSILEALSNSRIFTQGSESRVMLPEVSAEGDVTLESIRNYSVARVNELTGGRQRVICRNSLDLLSVSLPSAKSKPGSP